MKKHLLLLFVAIGFCSAQANAQITPACGTPAPQGADFCDFACVYCDFMAYSGTNNGNVTSGEVICGQITLQNSSWYGFIAGTQDITFEITTQNCTTGDGLQAAILPSCGGEALVCDAGFGGGGGTPRTVSYGGFIPGKTYFLLIDGFQGDVCDFNLQVTNGSTIAPVPGAIPVPEGPSNVCPGATVTYSIPPVSGVSYYHWTAPAGASINGLSNNLFLDLEGGNTVTVTFGQPGGQIRVSASNACYPEPPASARNVTVSPIPPTILPMITVSSDDLPYTWEENGTSELNNVGTYVLTVVYTSWLGCDSTVRQTIKILPSANGKVNGKVFWDNNNNGVKDANELSYASGTVVMSSSGVLTNTDANGAYSFSNQVLGDTIRAISPFAGVVVNPPFQLVQSGVANGYDFGLFPVPDIFDLNVVMNATAARPGFNQTLTVKCQNLGIAAASNVVLHVELPSTLDILSFSIPPTNSLGSSLSWDLGTLQPAEIRSFNIILKVPVTVSLGTQLQYTADVTPVADDLNALNNFYTLNATVVGSYDPNDKNVVPAYVTPALLANGSPFEYSIRFQNTGTYPAEFVRVIDTLGDMVDPASFRFLAASHPCTWKMHGAGIVEFLFENIQLPDSSSNEPGSHGFVKFTVKPKKNVALGTVIKNFCDIYFDFNAPVRTNTAGTKVVYFLPGQSLPFQDALFIKPNPTAFFARCDWKQPAPMDGRIRLFDVTGLPRLEMPVTAGQSTVHLDVSNLPPGLYFVVLEAGSLVLTNRVVVMTLGPLGQN